MRAYRWRVDPTFEGRHDLRDLLKAGKMLETVAENHRRRGMPEGEIARIQVELHTAMNEVAALWHNNLRYASEARLSAYLRKKGRTYRIRGNPLKKNASDLLKAAQVALTQGESAWHSP